MKRTECPLLWDPVLSWLCKQLRTYKIPFFTALLSGLLAYTYAFTNKLPNHDEVTCLFNKGATYESGRWGLEILERFLPSYSMPWLYGILTLVLMAAAVCVIVSIADIESKRLQGLLAGCVTVFPALTATFGYMFTAPSYGIAFLLAVTAVWLLKYHPKPGLIPALGCMVFSLSIYQSYISVAAGLLLLILIRQLLLGEDVRAVIGRGVFYLIFLVVSLVGYYAATLAVNALRGAAFGEYAAGGMQLRLSAIPSGIAQAYTAFFQLFTQGLHGLLTTPFTRAVNVLALGSALVLLPVWLCHRKETNAGRIALLLALILLLPLAVGCMYLIMAPESIHALVLYGFTVFYVLAAVLADLCLPLRSSLCRIALHGMTLGMALILAVNIVTANRVSLYMHLQYENTYAFYTGLASDLRDTEGFTEDTQIAVIGFYPRPDYFEEKFADLNKLPGVGALHPDVYSKARFLEYYLGLKLNFASDAEIAEIAATQEYADMAVYPYYSSLKMIGDTLVVKLS